MKNSLKYWVSWLLPALLCAVWILAAEAGEGELCAPLTQTAVTGGI